MVFDKSLQAQPHCTSPIVVFKYRATPTSPGESSILTGDDINGSDQDDDQGKGSFLWWLLADW